MTTSMTPTTPARSPCFVNAHVEWSKEKDLFQPVLVLTLGADKPVNLSVEVKLPKALKVDPIRVGPSSDKVAALPANGAAVTASTLGDCNVKSSEDGEHWVLELLFGEQKGSWSVPLSVVITRPAATTFDVKACFDEGLEDSCQVVLPAEPSPSALAPHVVLTCDKPNPSRLKPGDAFVLGWDLVGVVPGNTVLVGPVHGLPGAVDGVFQVPDAGGKASGTLEAPLTCLGPAAYTLRAFVPDEGGNPVPVERTVVVGLDLPRCTGTFHVLSEDVLPRGPLACRWFALNVSKVHFSPIGKNAPDMSRYDQLVYGGLPRRENESDQDFARRWERQSVSGVFTVPVGPPEEGTGEHRWDLDVAFVPPEGDAQKVRRVVRAASPRRWTSTGRAWDPTRAAQDNELLYAPETAPKVSARNARSLFPVLEALSMAAGCFKVVSVKDRTKTGEQRVVSRRHWVAVAGGTAGIEVHVRDDKDRAVRVDTALNPDVEWLPQRLFYNDPDRPVIGVGAANDLQDPGEQHLVVLYRSGRSLCVTEIRFPLPASAPCDTATVLLSTATYGAATRARVLALGARIFVVTDAGAFSYDRSAAAGSWTCTDEPTLAPFGHRDWEIATIPDAPGNSSATGTFYALHVATGVFRRIDIQDGVLAPPINLAPAFGTVARLHGFQEFQAGLLQSDRLRYKQDPVGVDRDAPIRALFRVGGALIARSETLDSSTGAFLECEPGQPRQGVYRDRAYDPRLDTWIVCGHPFYTVKSSHDRGVIFCDENPPGGDTVLYCRQRDGTITFVSPVSPAHLGFVRFGDLRPAPRTAIRSVVLGDVLPVGGALRWDVGEQLPGAAPRSQCAPQRLMSPDLTYTVMLDDEGALVVQSRSSQKAKIKPKEGASLVRVTEKGDLEMLRGKAVIWQASLHGGELPADADGTVLAIDDRGDLSLRRGQEQLWRPPRTFSHEHQHAMLPGDQLVSPNGKVSVRFEGGRLEGVTGSWSAAGTHRVDFVDGHLVLLDREKKVLWSSAWHSGESAAGARLVVEDDGRVELRDAAGQWRWHTPRIYVGSLTEPLLPGDLVRSPSGRHQLEFTEGVLRLTFRATPDATPRTTVITEKVNSGWRAVLTADADIEVVGPPGKGEPTTRASRKGAPRRAADPRVTLTLDDAGCLRVTNSRREAGCLLFHDVDSGVVRTHDPARPLNLGEYLLVGDKLVGGTFCLECEPDRVHAITAGGDWSVPAAKLQRLELTPRGAVEVWTDTGLAWSSNDHGGLQLRDCDVATLGFTEGGRLEVGPSMMGWRPAFPGCRGARLESRDRLQPGEYLEWMGDGAGWRLEYRLSDHQLVLTRLVPARGIASEVWRQGGWRGALCLDSDGELALRHPRMERHWSVLVRVGDGPGYPGAHLELREEGLVLVKGQECIWRHDAIALRCATGHYLYVPAGTNEIRGIVAWPPPDYWVAEGYGGRFKLRHLRTGKICDWHGQQSPMVLSPDVYGVYTLFFNPRRDEMNHHPGYPYRIHARFEDRDWRMLSMNDNPADGTWVGDENINSDRRFFWAPEYSTPTDPFA